MGNRLRQIQELAMIELAKRDFYYFCVYMCPQFFTPNKPHLKMIAGLYMDIFNGDLQRVVISMPPRYGKSFITSYFCAWCLGRRPDGSIMRNTYSASLSEDFSHFIRELIQSEKYLKVFPHIRLKKNKQKIDGWAIEGQERVSYFCAGVGGSITGKGCNMLAILDDPIKNIEDGMSETILNKTWAWYTSTHLSRLEKGCAEIIVATRWNTKDPSGRVLALDEKGDWKEIKIPALDRNGQSTCPEIKTTEEFLYIKKTNDSYIWDAEYQQEPADVKGVLYNRSELQYFSLQEIQGVNPTVVTGYTDTADTGADSLCSLIGYHIGEKIYIVDVIFNSDPIEITEPLVVSQIVNYSPSQHTIESNNGGRIFANNVKKAVRNLNCKTTIKTKHTTQNKETRILMKSGQVKEFFVFRNDYLPGSDYDKFMQEFTSYVKLGKNKHDDSVDAVTGLAESIFDVKVSKVTAKTFTFG